MQNVAHDPYTAAKFFHFLITTILETLFSITLGMFNMTSNAWIFSRVSAYFGMVESQDRGTL
jgi:hypothetical protein